MQIHFFWNADMPQFRPNRRGHSLFLDHPPDTRVIWAWQELVARPQGLSWVFECDDNYLKIQKIFCWNSKKIAPTCTFGSNMRIWPRKTPTRLLLQHVAVSAGNVMNRTSRHLSCVCFWGCGTLSNFWNQNPGVYPVFLQNLGVYPIFSNPGVYPIFPPGIWCPKKRNPPHLAFPDGGLQLRG